MNNCISRGIIASAMSVSLALCAAPAWAADFEDANETPTLSSYHLTQSQHCYWSARMTIDMGADTAKGFGDRHEAESSGADKNMDLSNNATGRSVALTYKTYASASNRCETLAKTGKLVTLK